MADFLSSHGCNIADICNQKYLTCLLGATIVAPRLFGKSYIMQKQLKPCPFCGKQPELISQHDEKAEYWVIRCCDIDDFASWSSLDEIIEKWNTRHYADVRRWFHYPIEMPVNYEGQGPATVGKDAVSITYEVWDVLLNSHSSFTNLPDAINEAIRLNDQTPKEIEEDEIDSK